MPASSSSLASTRPFRIATTSTSGVACVWPAGGAGASFQRRPSFELRTTASLLSRLLLVTIQRRSCGPTAILGSVHGRLGATFPLTFTLKNRSPRAVAATGSARATSASPTLA